MSAVSKGSELTEAQSAAIESIDRSMSVVAGAGSGKTTVLVERCLKATGGDWGEIDRLLAITFTEKAAAELKARLRRQMPARWRYRLEGAWIGTFHACCARILRQHAPLIGIDPSFEIVDENAAGLAIERGVRKTLLALLDGKDPHAVGLVDALDFKAAAGALGELMQFRWHAGMSLADPGSDEPEEEKILKELKHVYKEVESRYLAHLARAGALDFQELERLAIELLRERPEVLEGYRRRFRHILVDEFQDTSDAQTELVLNLFDPRHNRLCIVGDPRQSIYRFRGANIDCFATALESIRKNNGETVHLAHNFRSSPGIVRFVNRCQESISDALFGRLVRDGISPSTEGMIAARAGGGSGACVVSIPINSPPNANVSARRASEAAAIASFVSDLTTGGGMEAGDIACLFQALTNVSAYESAFRRAGIPYRLFGGRGLLERQEIADLMSVLSYGADPSDEVAILGILRSPLAGLSDDDLVMLAGPGGDRLAEAARKDARCALLGEIESMARHLAPSEIMRRALDLTGYESLCHRLDPSGGMAANVERFISLAASIERQEPTPLADFAGFMRELKERSARLGDVPAAGDSSAAVKCMTVHAAKGLEFPVVILPDLIRNAPPSGGNWRFSRIAGIAFKLKDPERPFGPRRESQRYRTIKELENEAAEAESKRLLYVAMTRARDLLALPVHPGMTKDGLWHRWLMPVIEQAERSGEIEVWQPAERTKDVGRRTKDVKPPLTLPSPLRGEGQGEGVRPSSLVTRSSPIFTVSELECHGRCPQEYYLKHELGLPAGQVFKEKAEKLPANVKGSIVHGVLARLDPSGRVGLNDLVETEIFANGVLPDEKNIRAIRREIDAALDLPIARKLASGSRELKFDWNFGQGIITGSIDWLLEDRDGGLEIVDFKTDDVKRHEVGDRAREYELQLACYALAAEAALGKKIGATSLVFLSPGVVHRVPMDAGRRKDGEEHISRIVRAILQEDFAMRKRKPPCFTCPYHHNGMCWGDRSRQALTLRADGL